MPKLIEYKGGGYDGCVWEYNYTLKHDNGDYEVIFVSGVFGEKEPNDEWFAKLSAEVGTHNTYVDIVDLKNEDECERFAKHCNVSTLIGLAKWFEDDNVYENTLPLVCDQCRAVKYYIEDVEPLGYSGDGGIAISAKELLCRDCFDSNCCERCGEYCNPEHNPLNEEGYCNYCAKEEIKEEIRDIEKTIKRKQEEMREAIAAYNKSLVPFHLTWAKTLSDDILIHVEEIVEASHHLEVVDGCREDDEPFTADEIREIEAKYLTLN